MDEPTSRVCTGCGAEKPLDEFPRHRSSLYGRRPRCKPCWNEQKRAWRKANPESVRESKRRTRGKHPRWSGEREWARDPVVMEKRNAAARARLDRLAQRTEAEIDADWNRLRPSGLKACQKCRAHLPRESFAVARRMADGRVGRCRNCHGKDRLRGRRMGEGIVAYWLANGMSPYECTYCGCELNYKGSNATAPKMHVDHIKPVLLGGLDEFDNLAPACPSCNCSKGARTLVDWLTSAA